MVAITSLYAGVLTILFIGLSAQVILLHMIGLPLLAGRVMHGLGLAFVPRQMRWRVWGMMATATSLAIGACAALLLAL